MSDERTGRELTPQGQDRKVEPLPERSASVERFSAGVQAHTVGLTEERAAAIVRQSGNARNIAFLATLVLVLFVPVYWFYELGVPVAGIEGRQEREGDAQYVTDVSRGYALYLANCARCHGEDGEGGIGPALNDQAKLYNTVREDGLPGTGHLNPNYLESVLREGGRYVCGDPNSVMPAWLAPRGPLNYRQVEELIAYLTASTETTFEYHPEHQEVGASQPPPAEHTGWRDPDYSPEPGATPVPACWRPYSNPAFPQSGGGGGESAAPIESPGTAEQPRAVTVIETAQVTIESEEGERLTDIQVKAGEVVEFTVTNEAGFPHNFYIGPPDQLKANAVADLPGVPDFNEGAKTFTYEVPADAEGTLEFACTVPGHYDSMHGTLTIQE